MKKKLIATHVWQGKKTKFYEGDTITVDSHSDLVDDFNGRKMRFNYSIVFDPRDFPGEEMARKILAEYQEHFRAKVMRRIEGTDHE